MHPELEKPQCYTKSGVNLGLGAMGFLVALLLEGSYEPKRSRDEKIAEDVELRDIEEELFDMGDYSPLFMHVL